jgi:serpin B
MRTKLALLPLSLLALAACDDGGDGPVVDPEPTGDFELVRSELARELAPDATADEMAALARGNHELTLDLYRETVEADANYMVSTLSIRAAFAMVYAGARGETATEMADVLRFDPDAARFHTAFNALDLALASRNDPGDGDELDPVELLMANAFWGQVGTPWSAEYLDVLALNYGAGVYTVDFDTDAEGARETINTWVEDKTRDRIVDLLPEGSIRPDTAAVLTNAIYFKAPWELKFDADLTRPGDFTTLAGGTVEAQFMTQLEGFDYAEGSGWQALEMDFRLGELAMVFVLPAAGTFADFEASLDADGLEAIVAALEPAQVDVTIPRFTFETGFTLSEALKALGMEIPFSGAADLSGMLPGGGLYIDEAFHKTFIAVDETGAEAAAATAVVVGETSVPVVDAEFTADRPFFFGIRDLETDVWLFFGRLADPS